MQLPYARWRRNSTGMGSFLRGDVVIAPVPFEERGGAKTRPAVVVATGTHDRLYVCPVSSKPSFDGPCIPISIDDFAAGGLDLFGESFVLTSKVRVLHSGEVLGKRGHLTEETITAIRELVPRTAGPGDKHRDTNRRSSSRR